MPKKSESFIEDINATLTPEEKKMVDKAARLFGDARELSVLTKAMVKIYLGCKAAE